MRNFVIINGVNSNTINGLGINELPPITKPEMRNIREEIDGRDGDIITELGYSAYDKTITIGLFGTGYDINNIISFFNGEGTITFSNEDDKYYKYKIINQIDYEALLKFKQATITFHCQPFKYPLSETPLEIEYDYIEQTGETLTLNNTGEATLQLSLKGNTSQYTTTGKNKASNVWEDYTQSPGTANYRLYQLTLEQGKTYTLSGILVGIQKTSYYNFGIVKDGDNYNNFVDPHFAVDYNTGNGQQYTFTVDSSYVSPKLICYVASESVFEELFTNYNIQLEEGSSITSFEEYTGGIASPSPNFSQQIHEVSGDNEIYVTGKNILNPKLFAQKVIDSPYSSANVSTYNSETGELSIKMGNSGVVFDNFKENIRYTIILKYNIATNGSNLQIAYTDNTTQNITPTAGSGIFRLVTTEGKSVASIKHSAYDSTTPRSLFLKESGIFEGVIDESDFVPFGDTYELNLGVENLFNKTSNIVNNKYIGADGSIQDEALNWYQDDYIEVKPSTNYIMSSNSSKTVRVALYDSSKTFISRTYSTGSVQVTTTSSTKYVRLSGYNNANDNIQLEIGTKANSYSPFGQTPIKMRGIGTYEDYFVRNSGKNLFDGEYQNSIVGADGIYNTSDNTRTALIEIEPNTTYSIKKYINTGIGNRLSIVESATILSSGQAGTPIYYSNSATEYTYTSGANAKYLYVYVTNDTSNIPYLMINKGSTYLPYEPYGTGLWCKYNAIKEITLDGTESWSARAFPDNNYLSVKRTLQVGANGGYCDNFTNNNQYDIVEEHITLSKQWNECCFAILNSRLSTPDVAGFKTWLSTHNTQVDYILSTPYLSLIENETLISQLDAIEAAKSYEGQTNISQNNNDKPFIISAKALEKGSDEVVVNNIGNATSKPLIALEGTGNINIYLDGTQVLQANVEDKMNIDIDKLEAYNPDTSALLNRQVIGNYNSMTFQPGNNKLTINGSLSKATITNYIRWL